jgi:hypothetical protein
VQAEILNESTSRAGETSRYPAQTGTGDSGLVVSTGGRDGEELSESQPQFLVETQCRPQTDIMRDNVMKLNRAECQPESHVEKCDEVCQDKCYCPPVVDRDEKKGEEQSWLNFFMQSDMYEHSAHVADQNALPNTESEELKLSLSSENLHLLERNAGNAAGVDCPNVLSGMVSF